MIAWKLIDPVTTEEYIFPRNPRATSSPNPLRRSTETLATVVDSRPMARQTTSVAQWTFEGKYVGDMAEDIAAWMTKKYPVRVRDHLDQVWEVILDRFEPTEALPSARYAKKGTYSMSTYVLRRIS